MFPLPLGRDAVDLTDATIGGTPVLRRAAMAGKVSRWWLRCDCGAEFMLTLGCVRRHQVAGTKPVCSKCQRAAENYRRSLVKRKGRTFRYAKREKVGALRYCEACCGLPHRRPLNGHCPRCHERYEADAPVTLDEVMSAAQGEARIYPEGGL